MKSSLADASRGKEPRKRDFEPRRVGIVRRARRNVSGEPTSEARNQCSMISLLLSLGRDRGSLSADVDSLTQNHDCRPESSYHVSRIPDSLCSCRDMHADGDRRQSVRTGHGRRMSPGPSRSAAPLNPIPHLDTLVNASARLRDSRLGWSLERGAAQYPPEGAFSGAATGFVKSQPAAIALTAAAMEFVSGFGKGV